MACHRRGSLFGENAVARFQANEGTSKMKLVITAAVFFVMAYAQSPVSPALPTNVQVLTVPASTSSTTLNVTVDASPNGGDFIDVVSPNSQVLISLILPGGTVVTPVLGLQRHSFILYSRFANSE
jgi:hypothetical protein